MKRLSSRVKIALLSAGLSGLVLIVFGAFAWMTFYQGRIAATDREIKSLLTRHPGLLAGRGNLERLDSSLAFTYGEEYTNTVFLVLRDAADHTIYQSPGVPDGGLSILSRQPSKPSASTNMPGTNVLAEPRVFGHEAGQGWGRGGYGRGGGPPGPIMFSEPEFLTASAGGSVWRIGLVTAGDLRLAIGLNLRSVHAEMNRVRTASVLTLPVALLLIGLIGWVVAGRALRPLNTIAETADAVTAHGLDRRIPESDESPEIRRVITLLNRMMNRLEKSFRQATRFSADASHELKTPLAVMQGELELALQTSDPGSAQQRLCNRLLESVHQLKSITRSLLLLAQADAGQLKLTREAVNLSEELKDLMEDARALAGEKDLKFQSESVSSLTVHADRALLRMAILNLLSNAVKYNEINGRVHVLLADGEHTVSLEIGNSGCGIPPEEQSKLFNRFHRVRLDGNAPVDGLGLGLSLAREIARAHRGDLTLIESRPGWTAFKLTLPKE